MPDQASTPPGAAVDIEPSIEALGAPAPSDVETVLPIQLPFREPAYAAVREIIRRYPPSQRLTGDQAAASNGRVWRSVEAALDAMGVPREAPTASDLIAQAMHAITTTPEQAAAAENAALTDALNAVETALAAALGDRFQPAAADAWQAGVRQLAAERDQAKADRDEARAELAKLRAFDRIEQMEPTRTCSACGASWTVELDVCPHCDAPAACCDLHGANCEPPSELCCGNCTETGHPYHFDGRPCVLPPQCPAKVNDPGGMMFYPCTLHAGHDGPHVWPHPTAYAYARHNPSLLVDAPSTTTTTTTTTDERGAPS